MGLNKTGAPNPKLHPDSAGLWRCANLVETGRHRAPLTTRYLERWRSRQPHPGTRIIRYRCCLPALAEFANYRRGRTDGTTVENGRTRAGFTRHILCLALRAASPCKSDLPICRTHHFSFRGFEPVSIMLQNLAERAGFEPAKRYNPLTHFPGVLLQPLGHLSVHI